MQALLPLIKQMCEGVASGKYDIAVFEDLHGVFGAVSRKGALYKLHKIGTLTIFSQSQSFPTFSLTDFMET